MIIVEPVPFSEAWILGVPGALVLVTIVTLWVIGRIMR
jgi:hypothetical protein